MLRTAYFDELGATVPAARYSLDVLILVLRILVEGIRIVISRVLIILFGQCILNRGAPKFILQDFIRIILHLKMIEKKLFEHHIKCRVYQEIRFQLIYTLPNWLKLYEYGFGCLSDHWVLFDLFHNKLI